MGRNAQEVCEEREAPRREQTEADKAEAAALKKLAEAEADAVAKKRAEEGVYCQAPLFVIPLNSRPPKSSRHRLGEPAVNSRSWRGELATSPFRR